MPVEASEQERPPLISSSALFLFCGDSLTQTVSHSSSSLEFAFSCSVRFRLFSPDGLSDRDRRRQAMTPNFRWTVLLAAGISFVFCSGCASVMGHRPNAGTAKPYPGVRIDANQIVHPSTVVGVPAPGVVFWSIVDFPFSAVLDT